MSVYVVGHKNPDTDSVASAIAYASLKKAMGVDAVPVMQGALNPESQLVLDRYGFAAPEIMTDVAGKKVMLVDFSDIAQGPANMADVVEVVDHHKIGDVTTNSPIFFYAKPVGCTCTVINEIFKTNGIAIAKNVAGIMTAAILSDTVNFKSPTCTPEDKVAVKELAAIAGIADTNALFMDMLKAKSAIDGVPVKDLLYRDYKDFDMKGNKVGIGQLELATLDQAANVRADLMKAMEGLKAEGRHSVLFMLTDVVKEGTDLLVISKDPGLIESAFGAKLSNGSMWCNGMMSRKKQTVPPLQKAFGC
ncbi:MAG: manganese-dependent inorganic pyrophosphatase [Deltaproteobacteria bacterium RIFOXYD12_FULL_50_9]|nr:MAG: manganese-dependent inorganic pyrophosphatase [Deltaproteobacteria bacterium RIFOXYD12_FULL_50_9]